MARFFPAEPDERPLAAGGNGLDGAVLGILAYAVLFRGQLRRSKHLGSSTYSFSPVSSLFQHFSRSFTHEPEACFSASSSTDL